MPTRLEFSARTYLNGHMDSDLASVILQRAYELDGINLDRQAQRLGKADWTALISQLEFGETATGGGCMMLTAELPLDHILQVTDGEADLPVSAETFWLGIINPDDEEEYALRSS